MSCHFVAVSSWLIVKNNYHKIKKKNRIDFWIGIGTSTWIVAIISTVIGFISAEHLNKNMMIGLAVVNPIYFMCAMISIMNNKTLTSAILLGAILGPSFHLISSQWSILLGGVLAGTIAFFIGEKNDS